MKNLFYLLFILLFSFSSCSKENNKDNVWGEPFKINVELRDELQNQITKIVPVAWLKDNSKIAIGTSSKTQNGFELLLKNPLDPVFLYPLKEYTYFMYGEIDNDVMCYGAVSLYAYKENTLMGTLLKDYYYNDPENRDEVSYSLCLMYVADDATVSGNCIADGKPFRSYSVNLKRGWNLFVCIQTIHYSIEGAHDYTSLEFTSEIPDNLVWRM